MGRYQGIDIEMMRPNESRSAIPSSKPMIWRAALRSRRRRHRPGAADPGAGQRRARHGAQDHAFTPATGVSRDGEWIVHTDKGDIRCEYVVNAAGYYAQRVGEWFKPLRRAHRADDGDEPPVYADREIPRWQNGPRSTAQAAAAARRRQLLLPAAGKDGLNLGPTSGTARRIG